MSLSPETVVPVLVALAIAAVAWVVISVVARGDQRTEQRLDRIGKMGQPGEAPSAGQNAGAERFQELLEKAAPALAKPLTPNEEEGSALKIRLANGGWRAENAVQTFLAIKFVVFVLGIIIAVSTVGRAYGLTQNGIVYSFLIIGIGFYIPDFFVKVTVQGRQDQIFRGLPDALDLMVVCVEAGLGLDAAMRKVCEEMGHTFPIISEEFSICNFQLQMGRPRREVLHDLGIRTGVDDMKALAAILIQADRFGSSIAQALRVQSDSMRVRRKQIAEEKAAQTAVQLLFPLVMFIFPSIFIVLVGPAAVKIMQTMLKQEG